MQDILNLLPGPELKKIAKMYHVKAGSKNNIIDALKKLGRQQMGVCKQKIEGQSGITRSVIKRYISYIETEFLLNYYSCYKSLLSYSYIFYS